jgi:hypothetical protein
VGLVDFSGLGRERERENTGEQTSSSPASARLEEEETTQSRSKRHCVVFHTFFLGWKKMNLEITQKWVMTGA